MTKNKLKKKDVKYVSKADRDELKDKRKKMFIGMFMLVIMVLSVAGFALMTGGGQGGNSGGPNGNPSEIPFQQFTDPSSGQIFWGAIKNSEQFIFLDIEGFEDFTNLRELSNVIKSKNAINIYVDSNFTSSDTIYNLEKALNAFEIPNSRVNELSCEPSTLILTNEANDINGECMVFVAPKGEETRYSEALLYHMLQ
jgi:hypothetical protein